MFKDWQARSKITIWTSFLIRPKRWSKRKSTLSSAKLRWIRLVSASRIITWIWCQLHPKVEMLYRQCSLLANRSMLSTLEKALEMWEMSKIWPRLKNSSTRIKKLCWRKENIKTGRRENWHSMQCTSASRLLLKSCSRIRKISWQYAVRYSRNALRRTIFRFILSEFRQHLSSLEKLCTSRLSWMHYQVCWDRLCLEPRIQTLACAKSQSTSSTKFGTRTQPVMLLLWSRVDPSSETTTVSVWWLQLFSATRNSKRKLLLDASVFSSKSQWWSSLEKSWPSEHSRWSLEKITKN